MKLWLSLCVAVTLSLSLSQALPSDIKDKLVQLSNDLAGTIYFQGSTYDQGTVMKNTRYNSQFGAVARVKTTGDVSKLMVFCKENNLRPTIRSSGHDYIGRASRDDSISINLIDLNSLTVTQSDPLNNNGPTITVGSGLTWGEIYKKVHEAGYVVVGGSAQTVSPGGYTQGGGHSPLTAKLGFAVDSTLQFTLVTTNGSIITTTATGGTITHPGASSAVAFTDKDLYWAVLGGGGGTFGVVVSFTYRLHGPPTGGITQVTMVYPLNIVNTLVSGVPVMTDFQEILLDAFDDTWGGYLLISTGTSEAAGYTFQGFLTFALLHWGDYASGVNVINKLKGLQPTLRLSYAVNNFSTFYDYEKNVNDATGYRTYIQNRFLQKKDMDTTRLGEYLTGFYKADIQGTGCTITLLGGPKGKAYTLLNEDRNSVSDKFRQSYGSLSCGVGWGSSSQDEDIITNYRQSLLGTIYDIGEGTYFNEPDVYLDNWKIEYWGSEARYQRLLDVKLRYDPDHLLWCCHCVGSDLVTELKCAGSFLLPTSSLICLLMLFFFFTFSK